MIDERWQKWIKKEDKAVKEGKDETKEVEKQGFNGATQPRAAPCH